MMIVFWSQRIEAALVGKSLDEQLNVLRDMISEAEWAQAQGRGPAQFDLANAKRKWNAIYEQWISERLPSTRSAR